MYESAENCSVKNFIRRQKYRQLFLEIGYITPIIATMTLMEEICGKYILIHIYQAIQLIYLNIGGNNYEGS